MSDEAQMDWFILIDSAKKLAELKIEIRDENIEEPANG